MDSLATDPQHLAAGREHSHVGAVLEQERDALGGGLHDMLAVVEQDQQFSLADGLDQLDQHARLIALAQAGEPFAISR